MPRYYRRRYYYGRKYRYSAENMTTTGLFDGSSAVTQAPNNQTYGSLTELAISGNYIWVAPLTVIAASANQGIRKVKNCRVSISPIITQTIDGTSTNVIIPCRWALVYVPEGQNPNVLSTGEGITSLYEPNQNVISSGTLISGYIPSTKSSRLARNLNSGDRIMLLMTFATPTQIEPDTLSMAINVNVSYAIAYS